MEEFDVGYGSNFFFSWKFLNNKYWYKFG